MNGIHLRPDGQKYYASLIAGQLGLTASDAVVVTLGAAPQKAGSSDFLLGVEGRLSDTWALNGLMQYNFGTTTPSDVNSPFFRYIQDYVRTGQY